MLDERKAGKAITSTAAPAMACPKCADVPTTDASRRLKGAEIATGVEQIAYTHACPGCDRRTQPTASRAAVGAPLPGSE